MYSIAGIAYFIEFVIFPLIFVYFGIDNIFKLLTNILIVKSFSYLNLQNTYHLTFIGYIVLYFVLIFFNLLVAYSLVLNKKVTSPPSKLSDIIIPFIATFWFLLYNFIPALNKSYNIILLNSPEFIIFLLPLGLILSLVGLSIAMISIFHLRKCFGIFVEVKNIHTKGFYKYVRHPIYFGHLTAYIGFWLINRSLYALILTICLIAITIYRAKLEEIKLTNHSKEYEEYKAKTPFIIPLKFN